MMRLFGKSDCTSCSCSGNEDKGQETCAPEPVNYRSYKEQVLAVSRPRLQEAAMHAARQADEAIFEVVEAADVEEPGSGSTCQVTVVVKESSACVRVVCGVAAVALVLLSSLGTLFCMSDRNLTVEVALAQWVWLVFAWIYAAVICLSELKPLSPNCSETYQAGFYKSAPFLASQVGRACFHFAVGLQSLLFRPLYLSVPCCVTLCFSGLLLLVDARFRRGSSSDRAQGTDSRSGDWRGGPPKKTGLQFQFPRAGRYMPRLAIPNGANSNA